MTADMDELKRHLQSHFTDGLTIVVGSGLSCAEGLPGMGALAAHLQRDVPARLRPEDEGDWREIARLIDAMSLEPALLAKPPGAELERLIVDSTARLIAAHEAAAVAEVFAGNRTLRITRLMSHVLKPDAGLHIVTTNYDRLVEVGVEEAGLGVDTMFSGGFAGRLDEVEARMGLCRDAKQINRKVRLIYKKRAIVSKPHGSLDWYMRAGSPVRYAGELTDVPRLIVPPGRNKFRTGYEQPFDRQRERANEAIDRAARYLILGYGFADEHLETHLTPALRSGKPALVLTWGLSDKALEIATACPNVTALDRKDDTTVRIVRGGTITEIAAPPIWDLHSFIEEVLEP
ncbi:MAG: SIR2 family protein [Sphingomonas pseudosanguinis]|uniref:SIR2 family protein n=1 Tax=Sphingomonas pseudosanguinis TaxID=413712 RepID=UPI00391BF353